MQTPLYEVPSVGHMTEYGLPVSELDLLDDDAKRIPVNPYLLPAKNGGFDQSPFGAPSVFNWYLPDFSPAGLVSEAALVAPELQHYNETIVVNYWNTIYGHIFATVGTNISGARTDISLPNPKLVLSHLPEAESAYLAHVDPDGNGVLTNDPTAVLAATEAAIDVYDLYACNGWLKAEQTGDPENDPREVIIQGVFDTQKNNLNLTQAKDIRLREAANILFNAPQCMIQR